MTIHNLSDGNSVLNCFIAEIRDKDIQKDQMRFRRNLERLGEIFAYEISKTLNYKTVEVTTPLGISECRIPQDQMVLATILRAGLPLHNGLLNYFDKAQNAFIAAYRKYGKDNKSTQTGIHNSSLIEGKVLVLADHHAGNRSVPSFLHTRSYWRMDAPYIPTLSAPYPVPTGLNI